MYNSILAPRGYTGRYTRLHQVLFGVSAAFLLTACGTAPLVETEPADVCAKVPGQALTHVLPCYVKHIASQPLVYEEISNTQKSDVNVRSYRQTSQDWSPDNLVHPTQWSHDVDLYIPSDPHGKRALLIVNNGTNHVSGGQNPFPPNDFTPENLADIARKTRSIVVAVSNVPNQFLTLGDNPPSREDVSVAQSWSLFMEAAPQRSTIPLQVPMVAAVSQAMNLAQQELKPWAVDKFILSGTSKRGWTVWLSSLVDSRVVAIAPLVADTLDIQATFKHINRSYGGSWPIAFGPYYAEGITEKIDTDAFAKLMQIQDPLQYVDTEYAEQLAIPKYLINASGDDFFVPDNSGRYYDRLPGQKALRIVPNSDHAGIRRVSTSTLISLLNRLQKSDSLPKMDAQLDSSGNEQKLQVVLSEKPSQVILWRAYNPVARDFRYACGIRYTREDLKVPADGEKLTVKLGASKEGWQAFFVEATFSDGFIATTPAFITPSEKFPSQSPPSNGGACRTLPGR